jgi:hypothetical protein
MRWVVFLCAYDLAKHLKKRRFLEYGHAQNLQDCVEIGLDVAPAFSVDELRERHAQVLIETGKALDLVVAATALDAAALEVDTIIPGHGAPTTGAIRGRYLAYLSDLIESVRSARHFGAPTWSTSAPID